MERKSNPDPKFARAFVKALERAPLVVPVAALGAAALPEVVQAQQQLSPDNCVAEIQIYRPDYDKNRVLTDRATLPVSCSAKETLKVDASKIGSIRSESLADWLPGVAFGSIIGFLMGAAFIAAATTPDKR